MRHDAGSLGGLGDDDTSGRAASMRNWTGIQRYSLGGLVDDDTSGRAASMRNWTGIQRYS